MKKLLLLTGTMVLLLALLTPALVGLQLVDDSTQTQLQELTGQPDLRLSLNRGWFSSDGELEVVAPRIGGVDYPALTLRADVEVQHGPLLLADGSIVPGFVNATLRPELLSASGERYEVGLITVVAGLDGSLHARLVNGAWTMPGNGTRTTLPDLLVELDIARTGQMHLQASTSQLNISDEFMNLEIRAPLISLHSENLALSPLPGSLSISAGNIDLRSRDGSTQSVAMQGVRLDFSAVSTQGEEPTISLQQSLQIAAVDTATPITQLQLSSTVTGLDQQALLDYLTLLRDTQPLMAVMPPAELQAYVARQSEEFTLSLIEHALTQNTRFDMQFGSSRVHGSLDLAWPGEPTALQRRTVSLNRALRILRADLEVRANEAALARGALAAMVNAYVAQGLLRKDQDEIVLSAGLHDGSLTLNGQRFPLEPILNFLTPGQP